MMEKKMARYQFIKSAEKIWRKHPVKAFFLWVLFP